MVYIVFYFKWRNYLKNVFAMAQKGHNVIVTGQYGAGKTYMYILKYERCIHVVFHNLFPFCTCSLSVSNKIKSNFTMASVFDC